MNYNFKESLQDLWDAVLEVLDKAVTKLNDLLSKGR